MEGVEKDAAFSYADESKIDAALNGKKIAVKGYLVGVNKSGYPQVIVTSVEEVTATRSLAATRATTVSPTASALYVYDGENKTWKPYTLKEAKLLVAEPALYESLGADMIEKPEAVLPTYLKQNTLTLLWVTWLRWSTTRKPIRLWLPNTRWERTGQRQLPVSSSLPPLRRMPRASVLRQACI